MWIYGVKSTTCNCKGSWSTLTNDKRIYIENFNKNKNKNIIFSQMNDEPMWNKIDDNIIHFTLVYQSPHHTVEANWEALDY